MTGKPITRKSGAVHVNKPANGTAAAAVTLTGVCMKAGALVDFVWGASQYDPPATGWLAGTSDVNNNCSLVTVYPAAGTWWLWMRRNHFPKVAEVAGPVTVV